MNKELKNKGESLPLATKQSFSATPSSGDTPQRPVKTDCHSELVSESHFEQQNCHSELVSESHFELQNCHSELVSESHFPNIRFSGFSDSWQEKKLGEVAEKITKVSKSSKKLPYVEYEDINNNEGTLNKDVFLKEGIKQGILFSQNDVLFGKLRPYLKNWLIADFDGVAVGDFWVFRAKKISDSKFLYSFIQSPKYEEIANQSHGTKMPRSDWNLVSNVNFSFPALTEQQKIGSYFATLDKKITAQKAKVEQLKTLKKYMLQNMFPQTIKNAEQQNCHSALENCDSEQQNCHSELVSESHFKQQNCHSELVSESHFPKIRFAGFSDPWEEKKFSDFGSVAMCKRIFKEETSEDEEIPFFKIGTFGNVPDTFISRKMFEEYKRKYSYPQKGDILISASGTIGRTVEFDGQDAYFQDSNIIWLKHNNTIENSFLKILYENVKWNGIEGSTIQRLYNDNFLKTQFFCPSLPEQQKIGSYFATLDKNIANQNAKLEQLQTLKKYMLQNMFC